MHQDGSNTMFLKKARRKPHAARWEKVRCLALSSRFLPHGTWGVKKNEWSVQMVNAGGRQEQEVNGNKRCLPSLAGLENPSTHSVALTLGT